MALTDDLLVKASPRHDLSGGEARYYKLPNGYGLLAQSDPMLHSYPFAWEFAVVTNMSDEGTFDDLSYDTPLAEDVVVCDTDEEANEFIARARAWAEADARPIQIFGEFAPTANPRDVWIAGQDCGYNGGLKVFGLYSTEEKAWAAIGKMDTWAPKVVKRLTIDADPKEIDFTGDSN